MPKEHIQDPEQADHWEVDTSSNLEDFYSIVPIYRTSLQKLLLKKSLQKMRLINLSVLNFVQDIHTDVKTTLSEFGLLLTPAERDGNCFFHSLSMNIKDAWNTYLIYDIDKPDVTSLSMKLRHVFAKEILGERQDHYQSFVKAL